MSVYEWKRGSILTADPQVAGERLEKLRKGKGGLLRAEDVVADAARAKSPLHGCFEWDDATAAEAHRINQARYLIRSLVVKVDIVDREPAYTRAFVVVDEPQEGTEDEPAYTSIQHAMTVPILRAQVVARARKEFHALRQKYAELEELRDVFTAIDQTLLVAEEEAES